MAVQIQLRRDTSENWLDKDPVLALGEPGLETDTNRVKYGNGVNRWSELSYSVIEATTDLEDLNNVDISSPLTTDQTLIYDGSKWVNAQMSFDFGTILNPLR
jgi:hypothetical protein